MGRFIRLLLIILSFYFLLSTVRDIRRYVLVRRELKRLEARCRSLERENRLLQREVNRLKNDKFHIEKTVRKELGWVRKDEVIYLIR